MDWRTAYFAQARSDFEIFNRLRNAEDVPLCHKLHYLQMATEKFSKGFLTQPGAGPYERTHDAFQRFVRSVRESSSVRDACGIKNRSQFRAYIDSLMEMAALIESLSPEGDDHPNPEYPWFDPRGEVISPLEFDFAQWDIRANLKMIKMVEFIEKCLQLAY